MFSCMEHMISDVIANHMIYLISQLVAMEGLGGVGSGSPGSF